MCFFRELQRNYTTTSFFTTHTHTHKHKHTHTHVPGQQWLTGQWVFLGPKGGHATSENISKGVINVFSCLCLYFLRRHYAAKVFDD